MMMHGVEECPAGLVHEAGLLTRAEECELLVRFAELDMEPVVMRGVASRRQVRYFGWSDDFDSWDTAPAESVSLGSYAVMRSQQHAAGGERRVVEQPLEPQSAYVLTGAARSAWRHSVPAVKHERWSVTFRQLRAASGG